QVVLTETRKFPYDHLILATGSRTLPGTGSDGNGYELSKSLGHLITDLVPAEVPLVSNDLFVQEKTLQGLSFHDVTVHVYKGAKIK
ncbi:NAD(P)/FAD-dependent oxidoreductase, partial [Erysipelothrix rhusiopathiae]|nr:NAD(P)/FAD-dependent oxidoreductase [Erysipelothrix rhusiopathiae]